MTLSTVSYAKSDDELAIKIEELKSKQVNLEKRIEQFEMGWDMVTKFSNINIPNATLGDVKGTLLDNDYWFLYDLLSADSESVKAETGSEGILQFNYKSDRLSVAIDWILTYIWGGGRTVDLKNIILEADFAKMLFSYGTVGKKFTPLTMYYPYFNPDEVNGVVFAKELDRLLEAEQLRNERLLTGANLTFNFGIMQVDTILSKLGSASSQRYLLGINSLDPISNNTELGLTYVKLFDLPDFGDPQSKALNNEVASLSFSHQITSYIKVKGEFAKSNYSKDINTNDFDPLIDYAQNISFAVDSKIKFDLGYLRTGPFYEALLVTKEDLTLNTNTELPTSSCRALPYGIATPNRIGWKGTIGYQHSPGVNFKYTNTNLKEIIVIDVDDGLRSFDLNSFQININRIPEVTYSIFADNEKVSNAQGESTLLQSLGTGISGILSNDFEWALGYKRLRNITENEYWGISLLSLCKKLDANSELLLMKKLIDYQIGNTDNTGFSADGLYIEFNVFY